ncbi:signal peptide peptidase SppA [Aurantiacibacter gangjinensis]|uniref:Serine protease n=1 Tax=Aurantiacibacter gangjinensis TaxID=502682 RepID=A0A0G9MS59_9SPHN|nr:signal peptide peptidase SppA [Aurantiacibacter gangjinensis]APE27152.1 Periplasmic serine protease [Aurantiacibacter gangjinensis]KLE33555.1 serine protease [Aurantiacibacter gangjinensis]
MNFARKVWRLLVCIKDALALLFLLLFFAGLFAILSARPNPGTVRDGALLLEIQGVVVEEVAPVDPLQALLANTVPVREYAARDLVRAIDAAAGDERVDALALDLSGFLGGGAVHLSELAGALERFSNTDKAIYAYAFAYGDDAMLLAAHADEIWVDPQGGVAISGPGGENLYYDGLLERFNITANVYRVGTYKSAVEPWTESGMSDEAREQISQLYATLWQEWRAQVNSARPQADIDLVTSDVAGWLAASANDIADASLAAGLADRIGTRVEWGERIASEVGEDEWSDEPGAFAATDYDPWLANVDADAEFGTEGTIAVITVDGEITDGEAGPGSAGAARITALLDEALDDDISGLVVRINSPGGTVTGSEAIRRAVLRHRDKGVPVAVSMGNYAASGGYWIATAGQRLFGEPQTITGSIGVFLVLPSFENVLAEYGVTTDGVRTTGLSGQPDLLGGITPEADALLQASTEGFYADFLGLVAQSRDISPERADELGQGRVWDGGAARQLGLIDQFGDLDSAIAWVAERAELADGSFTVDYLGDDAPSYDSLLARLLMGGSAGEGETRDIVAILGQRETARLGTIASDLERLMRAEGVMARCLECTTLPGGERGGVRADTASIWRTLLSRSLTE